MVMVYKVLVTLQLSLEHLKFILYFDWTLMISNPNLPSQILVRGRCSTMITTNKKRFKLAKLKFYQLRDYHKIVKCRREREKENEWEIAERRGGELASTSKI